MGRPTELPVYNCPKCRIVWVGDPVMYEEPDRCPRCGRDSSQPFIKPSEDEYAWIGGGTSLTRLYLYSMTGGIFRYEDGSLMQTEGAMNEALFRR